jgi:signal transduction histidine kinase/ligand-binding sensor domain-containing protein
MWGIVRIARRQASRLLVLGILLAAGMARHPCAFALDPTIHITQYAHSSWPVQDGAFRGAPIAITQTKDGYLWIGTDVGLVRFDGVRFVPWSPSAGEKLLDPRVFSLMAARDGSLWIGTGYSISHWKGGELTNYPQMSGRIEAIAEDIDGTVWFVRTQITDGKGPLCRIGSEQWQCYGGGEGIPFPIALKLITGNSGELWIGGYDELCRWKPQSSASNCLTSGIHRAETFATLRGFATGRNGTVWAARNRPGPFLQLDCFEQQKWTTKAFPKIAINNSDITALFVDRDNTLWIGTANHGIFRVVGNSIDNYRHTDGLSSDAVGGFFQDVEGTIWVVTSAGIDNFRDVKVISYSRLEGLSAAGAATVVATREGTLWIGNYHALDLLQNGRLSSIGAGHGLPGSYVTTFFEDHAGKLWVGIDNGLWFYAEGIFHPVQHPDGSALGIVFAITEDARHNIWVRAGRNLDRIYDSRLQEERTSPQIATAYTLAPDPQGGILLGLVNGDLVQYEDGKTRTYPSSESRNTAQIRDLLLEDDGSVWGTTLDEAFRWKDGKRKNLTTQNGLPCDAIFALVEDDQHSLWLDSKCGLIEIKRSELERWWDHPASTVKYKLFDAFDGVQAGLTPLKPQATRSPDGRLWFVNGRILQMIDPDHLRANPVPPPVQIEEVLADRSRYTPSEGLRLPARTRDLEIDYTALSYAAPQKVLFRYKLEGHDVGWQEPGTRRQTFYNDLRPGRYRFRVIACNNDGIWSESGASLGFSILPAYYQTTWFRACCVVVFLLLLASAYQLRVRQLRQQFAIGLEARLNERTRIARDLHDTLLQTLHGLMFRFQAARNMFARRPEEALEALDGAINRTEQAIAESREAIKDLRIEHSTSTDLGELLAATGQDLQTSVDGEASRTTFQLIVEGERQRLSPSIQDEVYRIGRELLRNAFQHADAHHIEAEIRYDDHALVMLIRDDGKGIDPTVLKHGGRTGHWGLPGVRERAQQIRARIDFWTENGAGTEVQLRVPGSIAYKASVDHARFRLFRREKVL